MYKYRIHWKVKITGKGGRGVFLNGDKDSIVEIVRSLNRRIPELHHWIESSRWLKT